MKKPTQITPEQKKDLKALSRTRTEARKRRHRSGGTAQPGYATRYRPCAAQAPPSRRTKISSRKGFSIVRAAGDCGPYPWVGWASPSCRRAVLDRINRMGRIGGTRRGRPVRPGCPVSRPRSAREMAVRPYHWVGWVRLRRLAAEGFRQDLRRPGGCFGARKVRKDVGSE